ncbi:phage antirepressor KilAC domain-containing protein [Prevotella corporis]|uniref:phage antirepressor KilAC domain-containing protein n=1 Tax=Prevotella corporis TaxID=28128 RepID=UPI0023F7F59D|nr:phage antirepressor KilAC domain-containing protein [Prevotella corporis]
MDEIQIFKSKEFGNVRTLMFNNEPYLVGKDVAVALGYAKPENALSAHVDDEDKTITLIQGSGSNYKSNTTIINESGLYSLVFSSQLPTAKKFKRWVTSEVLPALRKNGGYIVATSEDTPDLIMARALQVAQATIDRHKKQLELANERIALQGEQLKSQAPKVEYYDQVLQSEGTMTTRQLAMSIGMTANTLNKKLCNAGIQFRQSGMYILHAPYSSYNLTSVRSYPYMTSDGRTLTKQYLVWNERGKQFVTMLRNNNFDAKKTRMEISPDLWMDMIRPKSQMRK